MADSTGQQQEHNEAKERCDFGNDVGKAGLVEDQVVSRRPSPTRSQTLWLALRR